MSKRYRKLLSSPLRAIISDILPYELPLSFSTRDLHTFLRSIGFAWIDETTFRVNAKIDRGSEEQLKILFELSSDNQMAWKNDGIADSKYKVFDWGSSGSGKVFSSRPHRFEVVTGAGKYRVLSLLHPRSMIDLARFMHDYSDSILYYCNRSAYSLRHPYSIAKTTVRKDSLFGVLEAEPEFDIELHNLEYESVSSHFRYLRYNNINRFYDSSEFRACERKYPNLLRADISKCFDSIYTHTISWVINGVESSKVNKKTGTSFGEKFDKCFQKINHNETSGICIGPEASRIFAEIILQEVDVLVARSISESWNDLVFGTDFEIFRYVDDYFIFSSTKEKSEQILNILKKNLSEYKLYLNESKIEYFQTPLTSGLSVAKTLLRMDLIELTKRKFPEDGSPDFNLFLSVDKAVKAYKRTLLETGEDHRNLSSYYLSCILREARRTIKKIVRYKALLDRGQGDRSSAGLVRQTAKYLMANIDLAFFVYSGSPSPTQSLKLCELIVLSVETLQKLKVTGVELSSCKDKIRRETLAQLNAVRDSRSFGVHTINLIDCLTHLDIGLDSSEICQILKKQAHSIEKLDVISILVLIRACRRFSEQDELRQKLIAQSGMIVADGGRKTEAAILKLSVPWCIELSVDEVHDATGLSKGKIRAIRESKTASLFSWDMKDDYYQRLVLKSAQMVY